MNILFDFWGGHSFRPVAWYAALPWNNIHGFSGEVTEGNKSCPQCLQLSCSWPALPLQQVEIKHRDISRVQIFWGINCVVGALISLRLPPLHPSSPTSHVLCVYVSDEGEPPWGIVVGADLTSAAAALAGETWWTGFVLANSCWLRVMKVKSALWHRQGGHQLEESSTKAILGFQSWSVRVTERMPFFCVTAHCTFPLSRRWLQLLLCPEVSFCCKSDLSSDKSRLTTLPLKFFLPVEI